MHFGAGRCVEFVPWAAGDAVQVLPSVLGPAGHEATSSSAALTNDIEGKGAFIGGLKPPSRERQASMMIKLVS